MIALPEAQATVLASLLGRSDGRSATALLRRTRGITSERRLQVYRNNLFASLSAALEAVYPVLARLVGADFFSAAAHAFIAANPSRSGDLIAFGKEFPAFLSRLYATAALPYLADVAALEWACHEVYHEADLAPLDPVSLARVPIELQARLRLHLVPAARFVASPYPVLRIWQANQSDAADETPISLDDGGVELLVARRDFEIEIRTLDAGETSWLRSLGMGAPLATATAAALARDPAFDLAAALARHVHLGSFTAWSIAPETACVVETPP